MEKRAFQRLPIEVNENISSFLDTDKDFANFNAICYETHGAIQSYRCGAWRAQWRQEYDLPTRMTGLAIKAEYQKRRMLLYTKAFTKGRANAEKNCIGVLKRLIIESFADPSTKHSNNMVRLERFLKESNILQTLNTCISIPRRSCTTELQVLHVCLAHWYFDFSGTLPYVSHNLLSVSALVVYARLIDFPMFVNKGKSIAATINVRTVLHMINFWRCHMDEAFMGTIYDEPSPKGWTRPVVNGSERQRRLSKRWIGKYAYIRHSRQLKQLRISVVELLSAPGERTKDHDELDPHIRQEDVEFDFEMDQCNATWPRTFEHHLQAMPTASLCTYNKVLARAATTKGLPVAEQKWTSNNPTYGHQDKSDPGFHANSSSKLRVPSDKAQNSTPKNPTSFISPKRADPQKGKDYIIFGGSIESEDELPYPQELSGILHELPEQSGIPGFQRISFMKYPSKTKNQQGEGSIWTSTDYGEQVDDEYYCYQGVVLPGGHMIFGRWWAPLDDENQYCTGPFILWAVDE